MSHVRSYRGNAHEEWGPDFQAPMLEGPEDPSLGTDFYSPTYDAYYPAPMPSSSRFPPVEPLIPRWNFETINAAPQLRRAGTQSASGARSSSSGLTRQHSLRRHNRSRFVDFTEFTSRRRSTGRLALAEVDATESSPEPQPYGTELDPDDLTPYAISSNSLPPGPPRGHLAYDPVRDAATREMLDSNGYLVESQSTSSSSSYPPPHPPRLRRGGVRAPEMSYAQSPLSGPDWASRPPIAIRVSSPRIVSSTHSRRTASYLTPRSSSPESSPGGSRLS
jgi:hypothetical protein